MVQAEASRASQGSRRLASPQMWTTGAACRSWQRATIPCSCGRTRALKPRGETIPPAAHGSRIMATFTLATVRHSAWAAPNRAAATMRAPARSGSLRRSCAAAPRPSAEATSVHGPGNVRAHRATRPQLSRQASDDRLQCVVPRPHGQPVVLVQGVEAQHLLVHLTGGVTVLQPVGPAVSLRERLEVAPSMALVLGPLQVELQAWRGRIFDAGDGPGCASRGPLVLPVSGVARPP